MIKNIKNLNKETLHADLCIVGSGPASLSMLYALKNKNLKIILIPGGSIYKNNQNQNLYKGKIEKKSFHEPLHLNRHREFGGSGNYWGGRCVPLDKIDLKKRKWIKNSGWPIDFYDLEKYYNKASNFLEISKFNSNYNFNYRKIKKIIPQLDDGYINSNKLEAWSSILNFKKKFKNILSRENIIYIDNSHLLKIVANKKKVQNLICGSLNIKFKVKCKNYVLACGGIENARILLNSKNLSNPNGVGNSNDLVGRYYMSHHSGIFFNFSPFDRKKLNYNYFKNKKGSYFRNRWWLNENFQKINKIGNSIFFLTYTKNKKDMGTEGEFFYLINLIKNLKKNGIRKLFNNKKNLFLLIIKIFYFFPRIISLIYLRLQKKRLPSILPSISTKYFGIYHQIEQTPCHESRIRLIGIKDKLGLNKVKLILRFNKIDLKTLYLSYKYFLSSLKTKKLGLLKGNFNFSIIEKNYLRKLKKFNSNAHHLGTTRMGFSKKNGVVDKNLKVFGLENLFIAGSSTFPTGGHANPTYTIIALSLRLSEFLIKKFKKI